MLTLEEYTVGWVCAITTEFVAACSFFDEEYDQNIEFSENDNNTYAFGRIGTHNVVVGTLLDQEYGTSSATIVANGMLQSFPNIRIGLMVGIAGGAPSSKHDIRLGDIVVSSPNGAERHGGVLQYDFEGTIQHRSFQITGYLGQPPTAVRTAISSLKAKYERKGHNLKLDGDAALNNIKKKSRFFLPPKQTDNLYMSHIKHSLGFTSSCSDSCGQGPNLVVRNERATEDDNPAVHYGLVARANRLMDSADLRDKLSMEQNILCFDMDVEEMIQQFPFLVVRGICDYSDSHQKGEWHGYAALMAAAYARDVLLQLRSHRFAAENPLNERALGTSSVIISRDDSC